MKRNHRNEEKSKKIRRIITIKRNHKKEEES